MPQTRLLIYDVGIDRSMMELVGSYFVKYFIGSNHKHSMRIRTISQIELSVKFACTYNHNQYIHI